MRGFVNWEQKSRATFPMNFQFDSDKWRIIEATHMKFCIKVRYKHSYEVCITY